MKLSLLLRQSAIYLLGNVLRRGLGFVMIPLYTAYLAPADYGIVELLELLVNVSAIAFGVLAVTDSTARIYYDYPDERRRCTVISTALAIAGAASLALAAGASLLATPIAVMLSGNPEHAGLVIAAFAAMFFGNVNEVALVYQRIKGRAALYTAFSCVQLVLSAAVTAYLMAHLKLGLWGFVLGKLIAYGLCTAALLGMVLRETGLRIAGEPARRIAVFGSPLILTSVCFFVIHFADRFFLRYFGGLADVGIYSMAYKFGFLVTYAVGEPFANVWGVSFYRHVSEPDWGAQCARVLRYLTAGLVLAALAIGLLGGKVLWLISPPEYHSAAALIPLVAFGYAFRGIGDFFRDMLFINKKVLTFSGIVAGSAAVNLGLDYVLIGRFGSAGAAWATILTWMAYMGWCWQCARRERRIHFPLRSFVQICALSAGVISLSLAAGWMPAAGRWGADILLLAAMTAALWVTGYVTPGDKAALADVVRSNRGAVRQRFSELCPAPREK